MSINVAPTSRRNTPGLGALFTQALLLLVTLVVSVVLIVLLTMGRRETYQFSPFDPVSYGAQTGTYVGAVADYFHGLFSGNLVGAATTPNKRKLMSKQIVDSGRRSLELLGVSLAASLVLGLGWGVLMDATRGRGLGALLFGLNMIALALPSFLIILLLISTVADITQRTGVRLAYTQGYGFDRHLLVPVAALALRGGAYFAQAVALAQNEVSRHEWMTVARAKGLGGLRLWWQHTRPLLYLPLLGGALGTLRVLVGSMILVEYLYNWTGLSKLLLQINNLGIPTYKPEPVEVGAAVILVLFFVITDALGRLALWGTSLQRHELGAV
ncbi:MAG: ABC transporter permease subunit [Roseiflexaceae bacterium]|nr:ABC transporter permease subunit [Roseiflexaceae bacterium]